MDIRIEVPDKDTQIAKMHEVMHKVINLARIRMGPLYLPLYLKHSRKKIPGSIYLF